MFISFKNLKTTKNRNNRSGCYVREKIRTPDTLVRSQVLYPAELRTHISLSWHSTNAGDRNRTGTVFLQQDFKSCASASSATPAYVLREHEVFCASSGEATVTLLRLTIKICKNNIRKSGTYRARTCDPLLVRQMLSQLS